MRGSFEWMDMTYEAEFSVPLLDLPLHTTQVLRSLHEFIHSRFPLRTADLQIFGGNALSDVGVRVTMSGGNGTIDVTAEKLAVRLRAPNVEQSLVDCGKCYELAEQALKSVLPTVEITTVTGRSSLSIGLGDGSAVARDFLRSVVKPGIDMELTGPGNAVLCPCINFEVSNDDERWRAVLHAYPNPGARSSITTVCWLVSWGSSEALRYMAFIEFWRQLVEKLLQGLDIETAPLFPSSMKSFDLDLSRRC